VSYGTIHAGKGLEFDTVLLPHLSANHLPDPVLVDAVGAEEGEANDGRLLYVGVTRARQNLILTISGQLTPLMPDDSELWVEVQPT
jgi:superfamily I DNA/RNA helicase